MESQDCAPGDLLALHAFMLHAFMLHAFALHAFALYLLAEAMNDSAPIGLLGGSFDPVHTGHLQLAQDAQTTLGLGEVVFIPAGHPWQKDRITPAADRLRMIESAISGRIGWRADDCEIARTGPSYTVETLRQWRAQIGPDRALVWILGFDQMRQLDTWHQWEDLVRYAHLAYARRAGIPHSTLSPRMQDWVDARRNIPAGIRTTPSGSVIELTMLPIDCSATQLRQSLASNPPISNLARCLSPDVLAYIRTHGLYSAQSLPT